MAEGKTGLIQGFKEFVMRGNVVDLAVAVVVGAAFTAVVKSFSDEIINPFIAALGGIDTGGFGFCLKAGPAGCTAENPTFVDFGAVFAVLVSFLITMLVVYFIFVLPMNKAREMARVMPKTAETPADVLLLTEIRDLLAEQRGQATAAGGQASPAGGQASPSGSQETPAGGQASPPGGQATPPPSAPQQ